MKSGVIFSAAMLCASAALAADIVIYSADQNAYKVVNPGDYKYEGGAIVPAGRSFEVTGNWDLSNNLELYAEVENLGDAAAALRLRLFDADEPNYQADVPIDLMVIEPHKGGTYLTNWPKPPADSRLKDLKGMRRDPFGAGDRETWIDASKVTRVKIYPFWWSNRVSFKVKRIVAKSSAARAEKPYLTMKAEEFLPFVDKYGQFRFADWPGKTHDDADLKKAREAEVKDLEAHPSPASFSLYGGWKDGPRLYATGSFRVEKFNGKWWLVDPEGYLFWSHGVVRVSPSCGIAPLDGRRDYFEWLPKEGDPLYKFFFTHDELMRPYYEARDLKETFDFSAANLYRKYGEDWRNIFAVLAHKRLKSWGLNTIANSSDKAVYMMDKTPYIERFEIKSRPIDGSHGVWWKFKDPFDPSFRLNIIYNLGVRKTELADPWCIGFFVDNEIDWGSNTSIARWALMSPATTIAKQKFVAILKGKYSDIKTFNTEWKSDYASWEDLLKSTDEPNKAGFKDCAEFSSVVVEEYFKIIREEFKKAAPNKLYLGCRFASSNEAVLRIAAKYCDVLSYNIYKFDVDGFELPSGIDKPVMIGEFHFGATDRGLFHPTLVSAKNQEGRAAAYERYITSALRHPSFIGAHWHQFSDQCVAGRFDGENFQVGLTDICDTPYAETAERFRKMGETMYKLRNDAALPATTAAK